MTSGYAASQPFIADTRLISSSISTGTALAAAMRWPCGSRPQGRSSAGHPLIGRLIDGAILSLFAIASGIAGVGAKRLHPRMAMVLGAIASASGVGLLALAAARHHLRSALAILLLWLLFEGRLFG
jgi:hypothetical protein